MTYLISDITIINYILFLLIIIQSILGIGILVLGTPILLFFNLGLPEALSILLPISILTSFFNILKFAIFNNPKNLKDNYFTSIFLDKKIKINFYLICLPSLFLGLILLKLFENFVNFKIVVSMLIILSLSIKIKFEKKIQYLSDLKNKFIFLIIGIVHGLTNSGGTILSLFLSTLNKSFKNESRINITYFYLLLALVQYGIFLILFNFYLKLNWLITVILFTIVGSIFGNILIKFINENLLKKTIEIMALIAAIVLLYNGIFI